MYRRNDTAMNASSYRRIVTSIALLVLLIFGASCYVWAMGLGKSALVPAERVCKNLLEAGYLKDEEQCVISKHPPTYIEGMIPLGVNENYVQIAMEGFVLDNRSCLATEECAVVKDISFLAYQIRGNTSNPFVSNEYYTFGFHNGMLTSMQWEN